MCVCVCVGQVHFLTNQTDITVFSTKFEEKRTSGEKTEADGAGRR